MTPVPVLSSLPVPRRSSTGSPDRLFALLALAIGAVSLLFYAFPGLDVAVSRWFYDTADGFVLADSPPLRTLRASSTWVMAGVLLLALLRLVCSALGRRLTGNGARQSVWLISGLAIGPGLLVNGVLKAHWGRPRPVATDVFGGEAPFQTVWVVSDWCDRNCSFVSGEAAAAAWLVAAALIAPRPIRTAATALAAFYATALSINRIAFGGHYLSDVLLAWLLSGLVFLLLHRLIVARRAGGTSPSAPPQPAGRDRP